MSGQRVRPAKLFAALGLIIVVASSVGFLYFVTGATASLSSSSSWITYHKDLARDGYDNFSNGKYPSFAWKSPKLNGSIYAEPLVYNGMVIVATENNTVYSLNDATGQIVWVKNLGTPVPGKSLPCGDINPSGITGTPAIDPSSNMVYAVAYLYPPQHHVLFALNLYNGNVMFNRTVDPSGVSALVEQQRGALAIANGVVYIPYGGLAGDCGKYHGYVLGVPENGSSTLSYQVPTGNRGGIWATSGPSVSVSSGSVFVATGNSASRGKFDFGESVIRLSPALKEKDFFAPSNWVYLNEHDTDLGSVGPAILGGSGLIFQIGKEGVGYLLNMSNLGGIGGQLFSAQACPSGSRAFGGTAYANQVIYVPCASGIVALPVEFGSSPSFSILWNGPQFFAGPPIVSGNMVWTVDRVNAVIYALNPNNGTAIFSHSLNKVAHFTTPTSADGRIFVAAENAVYAFNV